MLMNGIILTINGCDTLKPLGIRFSPFANSVHGIKYHKQCKANTLTIRELCEFLSRVIVIAAWLKAVGLAKFYSHVLARYLLYLLMHGNGIHVLCQGAFC